MSARQSQCLPQLLIFHSASCFREIWGLIFGRSVGRYFFLIFFVVATLNCLLMQLFVYEPVSPMHCLLQLPIFLFASFLKELQGLINVIRVCFLDFSTAPLICLFVQLLVWASVASRSHCLLQWLIFLTETCSK